MKNVIMLFLAVAALFCFIWVIVKRESVVAIASSLITLVSHIMWFIDSKENIKLKKQVDTLDDVAGYLVKEVDKKANANQGYYDM